MPDLRLVSGSQANVSGGSEDAVALGSSSILSGSSHVAHVDMSDPRTKAMVEGLQATIREWDHYAGFWHCDHAMNEWTVEEPTRLARAWRSLFGRRWHRNPARKAAP